MEADLGRRALEALVPSASRWWGWARASAGAALTVPARAIQRASSKLAREVITANLMVLALPGRVLLLNAHLADVYPPELAEPAEPELIALLARFEPVPPAVGERGARHRGGFPPPMRP